MAGFIWEIDYRGIYTYCSEKVYDILGYSPDEIIGKSVFETLSSRNANNIKTIFQQYVDAKAPIEDIESWHFHKKNGSVCLLFNGVPIFDDQDRLEGFRGVAKDITVQKRAEEEREKLITELEGALSKIKTLSGMIPICSSCKKIRDDKGYWNRLEAYIETHSDAEFSHGICPDCLKTLYPTLIDNDKGHKKKGHKERLPST